MRRGIIAAFAAGTLLSFSGSGIAAQIYGDYVEARTADVYTGPCFANAEVGLTGNQATMAWRIRRGAWNGVQLDGMTVVAVANAHATLGDPYNDPYPAKSLLIVDQNATEDQKSALVEFAKAMGGRLLENVVQIQAAPITMTIGEAEGHGNAVLKAGDIAIIRTRAINEKDHFCGNEDVYYPPLTELSHSMPVVSLADEYRGTVLGAEWRIFGKRNAFVGTFSR